MAEGDRDFPCSRVCCKALLSRGSQGQRTFQSVAGAGFAYIETGKFEEAEKLYSQCLKLDPSDAGAKNELRYTQNLRSGGAE